MANGARAFGFCFSVQLQVLWYGAWHAAAEHHEPSLHVFEAALEDDRSFPQCRPWRIMRFRSASSCFDHVPSFTASIP